VTATRIAVLGYSQPMASTDETGPLSEAERARIERRDRRQKPRMVVDNAGIKRVLQALARRRHERATDRAHRGPGG
jgi:hypothetical protein